MKLRQITNRLQDLCHAGLSDLDVVISCTGAAPEMAGTVTVSEKEIIIQGKMNEKDE